MLASGKEDASPMLYKMLIQALAAAVIIGVLATMFSGGGSPWGGKGAHYSGASANNGGARDWGRKEHEDDDDD